MVRKGRVGRDLKLKPTSFLLSVGKGSPSDHPGVEPVPGDDLQAAVPQLEDGHLPALVPPCGFTERDGSEEKQQQLLQGRSGCAHGWVRTGLDAVKILMQLAVRTGLKEKC